MQKQNQGPRVKKISREVEVRKMETNRKTTAQDTETGNRWKRQRLTRERQ